MNKVDSGLLFPFRLFHPIVLAVVFGLVLSLIPISPAFGDNIGACQGTTTTTKLSLGGRVITPTTILRASGNQPCASGETALNLISLTRTLIVSPDGTPAENGTALLKAMATISSAGPSADKPYLLKLEPGQYDLGNQSLTLAPFVDLEGSGEDTTTISSGVSSNNAGTVNAASNSEIRFVKITNSGSAGYQTVVFISTGATGVRLSHVTGTVTSITPSINYLILNKGTLKAEAVTISVSVGSLNVALFNDNTGTTTLLNSTLSASGGSQAYAFVNNSGSVTVQNSILTAGGAAKDNIAMNNNSGGTATVQSSILTATGGTNSNAFQNSGDAKLENNSLTASGAPASYAIYNSNSNKVYVGASELSGATAAVHISSGSVTCAASYTGSFGMLGSTCS